MADLQIVIIGTKDQVYSILLKASVSAVASLQLFMDLKPPSSSAVNCVVSQGQVLPYQWTTEPRGFV